MRLTKAETGAGGVRQAFTGRGGFRFGRVLVAMAAFFTALLLIINLVPKPPSQAAGPDDGEPGAGATPTPNPNVTPVTIENLKYTVGTATITPLADNQTCRVALPYTVTAPKPADAENVKQTIMKSTTVDYTAADGTRVIMGFHDDPKVDGSTTTFQVAAWPRCDQIGMLHEYSEDYVSVQPPVTSASVRNLRDKGPTIALAAYGTRRMGIPSWAKAALGILAGAAVIAVVSIGATAAGAAAAAAAGEVVGIVVYTAAACVAGAVSTAVIDYILNKFSDSPQSSWADRLTRSATGCVVGAGLGLGGLVVGEIGAGLNRAAGMAAAHVGGRLTATVTNQGGIEMADVLTHTYPVASQILGSARI